MILSSSTIIWFLCLISEKRALGGKTRTNLRFWDSVWFNLKEIPYHDLWYMKYRFTIRSNCFKFRYRWGVDSKVSTSKKCCPSLIKQVKSPFSIIHLLKALLIWIWCKDLVKISHFQPAKLLEKQINKPKNSKWPKIHRIIKLHSSVSAAPPSFL